MQPSESLTDAIKTVAGEEGEQEETQRFTEVDYSDYNPEEQEEKTVAAPVEAPDAASTNEVLLEQNVKDEDKLYDE